jgi:hypothetical protein
MRMGKEDQDNLTCDDCGIELPRGARAHATDAACLEALVKQRDMQKEALEQLALFVGIDPAAAQIARTALNWVPGTAPK